MEDFERAGASRPPGGSHPGAIRAGRAHAARNEPRRPWLIRVALASLAALALALVAGPAVSLSEAAKGGGGSQPGGADKMTYSGQATGAKVTLPLLDPIVLSDTGPLPSSGGALEASLVKAEVPGVLTAGVLGASTIGQGNESRSEASAADADVTVGGNTVSAGFLMARATASCSQGQASVSGSSEIAQLVINGQAITVTGQPNQTVELPNGRVVINEQTSSPGSITVNALHVTVDGVADVVISSAHADITCSGKPDCSAGKDFVTGGGWITGTPTRDRGNFAVAGGIKNGAFWGHLSYNDHAGTKVKGTGVTAYTVTGTTSRQIKGTAEVNGQGGFTYVADVADNGEPGRNDSFSLKLSNGYTASGTLDGGNIQLHKPRCK